ncbi:VWA domain-containing protein [Proteus mirabilis]|uniref:VWA domain-containing protein n=1 Tax=Providencia rettgeri TaxID=587 RepID=UPI00065E04B9|nr:VWA domain-containing protein [Providencia rettgeri]MBI6313603.1 VWA domain-containing protein [Proteus mirabilis]MBI6320267.1 VWA domain-containing protein [Proteus mirabilis]HCH7932931.1 VWA domain-containing protein [Proteus mirabilis]HCH7937763.1 VWA domain-containing protein [Providencia rettgeri]HEC8348810.1 VWA domain-containing protein [Providencia rettgeri]
MKQLRSAASLAIVANVLAGKFDISIKFTTDEAYCGVSESGKYEIGIPYTTDTSFGNILLGFLIHEIGHAKFTDFSFVAQTGNKYISVLENICEDIWIESKLEHVYGGAKYYLDAVRQHVFTEKPINSVISIEEKITFFINYVLLHGRSKYNGVVVNNINELKLQFISIFTIAISDKVDRLLEMVLLSTTTVDNNLIAKKLFIVLATALQLKPQDTLPPSNGSSGDAGNSEGNDPDGSGNSEGNDPDGSGNSEGNDPDGSGNSEGNDPDGSGSSEGNDPDGSGNSEGNDPDGSGNSDCSGVGESSNGPNDVNVSTETDTDDLDSDPESFNDIFKDVSFDSVNDNVIQDITSTISNTEQLKKDMSSKGIVNDFFNVAIINTEWKKNFNQATQTITSLDIKRSLNTGCRLRRSFEKLVHDNTTSTSRLKEQGARIKSSKLAGVKTGNTNIFKTKSVIQSPNCACSILLDTSSSMHEYHFDTSRIRAALSSVIAVLEGLNITGVSTACYAFPFYVEESNSLLVQTMKPRYTPLRASISQGVFTHKGCLGSTPLAESLIPVISEIALSREKKKMIFIITDGEPNDDNKTQEIINSATIEGIEVCTFVLNEDGTNEAYFKRIFGKNTIFINKFNEIEQSILQMCANLIVTAR